MLEDSNYRSSQQVQLVQLQEEREALLLATKKELTSEGGDDQQMVFSTADTSVQGTARGGNGAGYLTNRI